MVRFALTVASLALVAVILAVIGADAAVRPPGANSVPTGKMSVEFALALAVALGWAMGSALERFWGNNTKDRDWRGTAWGLLEQLLPRVLLGIVLFVVLTGLVLGVEVLGVGNDYPV